MPWQIQKPATLIKLAKAIGSNDFDPKRREGWREHQAQFKAKFYHKDIPIKAGMLL